MTVLTLLAVLIVGQPDRPTDHATIPSLPGSTLPAAPAVEPRTPPRSSTAPAGDPRHPHCLNCGLSFGQHDPDAWPEDCPQWHPSTMEVS